MLVAFCTQGHMSVYDVKKECGKDGLIPLVVLKKDNKIILPHFSANSICKKFCERNLPKNWLCGGVKLSEDDINSLKIKNWEYQYFDFPNIIKNKYEINVEIHEFTSDFDTQYIKA
jgi:hypothetical protein